MQQQEQRQQDSAGSSHQSRCIAEQLLPSPSILYILCNRYCCYCICYCCCCCCCCRATDAKTKGGDSTTATKQQVTALISDPRIAAVLNLFRPREVLLLLLLLFLLLLLLPLQLHLVSCCGCFRGSMLKLLSVKKWN